MHNPTCFQNHMGAWAIEPNWFRDALAAARAGHLRVTPAYSREEREAMTKEDDKLRMDAGASRVVRTSSGNLLYQVRAGVAEIFIEGALAKFDSKYGGTNTVRVREAVRAAANDADASAIMLRIDSPGGNVAGTKELADDVAAVNGRKPVYAYIEDLGASAAYWVASQAKRIYANEMALVGSIGTVAVLYDESKAAEMQGVKVHVISTGPMKGQGTPGTPVTPEEIAYVQGLVDEFNARFMASVQSGRSTHGRSFDVKDVATGGVWIAPEAKKLGLIDQVATYDDAFASIAEVAKAKARARAAKASIEIAEAE